jgi:hypothetical protein
MNESAGGSRFAGYRGQIQLGGGRFGDQERASSKDILYAINHFQADRNVSSIPFAMKVSGEEKTIDCLRAQTAHFQNRNVHILHKTPANQAAIPFGFVFTELKNSGSCTLLHNGRRHPPSHVTLQRLSPEPRSAPPARRTSGPYAY